MSRKLLLVVLALSVLLPSFAVAQELDMSKAPMVRNRLTWRTGRSEFKPGIGWSFNDRYFHNMVVNLGYNYHMLDWLAVGANVGYAFPIMTSFAENIESEKKQEGMSFPVPASHLGLMADAHLELTNGGKAMFWGAAAVAYDFHATLGVGVVQVRWNSEAESRFVNEETGGGMKVSPSLGVGLRVFLDEGVALSMDVTDHMVWMSTAAEVGEDGRTYTIPSDPGTWPKHNVVGMLSISIMMPYETTYED